ncbi:MAG: hypothetical protein P4L36_09160 [Holophaga sp.]|nr:hypothetical protein [Holophaga sp.]
MSRPPEPSLDRGFRMAYPAGLVLCVACPLALQLMLGSAIRRPETPAGEAIQQLGYSFTGLTVVCAVFVLRRWSRIRAGFRTLAAGRRARVLVRETLLYSVLFLLSSLFGLLYYALGGPKAEQFSRGFIALTTIMFFVFVPRLRAWREAAQGE